MRSSVRTAAVASGYRRRVGGGAAALAAGLFLLSMGPPVVAGSIVAGIPLGGAPPSTVPTVPLNHIVIVFQENHVYDNFFGTYCIVVGPYCSMNATGIPPGTCVPLYATNPAAGCIKPYPLSALNASSEPQLNHDWTSGHTAYDNGSLDGFYLAEAKHTATFGYYNSTEIPTYWDLAEQYASGDNMFASVLSYSTPNHWYLLAGTSPAQGINQSFHKANKNSTALTGNESAYLDEANATPTIVDLLNNASVSWKYYDYNLSTYNYSIKQQAGAGTPQSAFDFWNPLAAKAESYNKSFSSHIVPSSTFFTDAAAGALPNVSWVLPSFVNSDHPPVNLQNGQNWVSSIVNAVEASPDWSTSAIFVMWDDYGGFYDHQAPPQIDANGVSFRSPFLVIGPYVRENYVSHRFEYFESLLHLIEWRFGLPSLTARDRYAPLPLEYFDFNATPRSPMKIPGPLTATYPMPLQGLGPPPTIGNLTARAGPGSVTLNWTVPGHTAGVGAYELSYGPSTNPTASQFRIDGSLTSTTISDLAPGTHYNFTLAAVVARNVSRGVSVIGIPAYGAVYVAPSTAATWENLPYNGSVPSPRSGAAFGVDGMDNEDVLFGGQAPNGTYLGDTWVYLDGRWSQAVTSSSPSPRAFSMVATYPSTGQLVLFGGAGASGPLGDTWQWAGGMWTNLTSAVGVLAPVPRSQGAFVGDPSIGGLVLFGGLAAKGVLGDTWQFVSDKWSHTGASASMPVARDGASMMYDPTIGYAILFGGVNATGVLLNDTWRFSTGHWASLHVSSPPAARKNAAFAFDIRNNEGILFGGTTATGANATTWSFARGVWTPLHIAHGFPAPRSGALEVYDPVHQAIVLLGGVAANGTVLHDLWAFAPPTSVRLTGSPTYLVAGGLVFFAPVVSAGIGAHQYFWSFGDGGRSTLFYGWHMFTAPGNYTVSLTVVDGGGAAVVVTMPVQVR